MIFFYTLNSNIIVRNPRSPPLHKEGGLDFSNMAVALYYFSDLQSSQLAMQDSHPSLYCTKTWYHLYISDPFW